jgi:tetratricopeptide (TPR) repeat protein
MAPGRPAFRPRIVDFGLAKCDAGEPTMTLDGQVLGTLAYMSPEQLDAPHEVDGRGDVYSLGVVLYQMLTHELPFRGVSRMLQLQVLEDEPSPPRRLDDRIPRDLETIALKCLAKEPAQRYASAGDLADDLRRFLAGEPIRARPTGAVERLRRWCRRKPTLAGLAGGLVLTLLAGIAGVSWQWSRAEANLRAARRERDRAEGNLGMARRVVDEMYTRVAGELEATGMLHGYQRQLLLKALRFYETNVLPQSDDPWVRFDAGAASWRVGHIQQMLDNFDEAILAYRRALELIGPLVDENPRALTLVHALIETYGQLALCYNGKGRSDEALVIQQQAVAHCARLANEHPEVTDYRRGMANIHNNLAEYYQSIGRPAEAVEHNRENVAIYEALAADHADKPDLRLDLTRSLVNLGSACAAAGRPAEARDALSRAVVRCEALTEGHSGAPSEVVQLAMVQHRLGCALTQLGRLPEAVDAFRRAAARFEAICRTSPDNFDTRYNSSVNLYDLGTICHLSNDRTEAEAPYRRARILQERLVAERPKVALYRFYLAKTDTNLGILLSETGREGEAGPMLREAEEIIEGQIRDHPNQVEYVELLPEALGVLGKLYRESGRTAEAMRAYRRAREVLEALTHVNSDGLYNLAGVRAQCAVLPDEAGAGRPAGDRPAALDGAIEAMRRAIDDGFQDLDRLRRDTNLDPLRSRADFRSLETRLMDARFPADPLSG